jgi:PDZ domain-containing secreted protein
VVVAVLATAAVVRLPYYVLLPGQATAVEPLIHVDGAAT